MKRLLAIVLFCVLVPFAYGETLSYEFGTYIGEVVDGRPNGYGTFSYSKGEYEGDKYVGKHKNGLRHGHGTYTFASGSKYIGEFKDDLKHGHGTYIYADGDKYIGEYKNGKRNGHGTYTFASGAKYVGEYKDGQYHGYGTYIYADGAKYVGEYKNGKKSGQGTLTFGKGEFEGDKYVGEFKNGKKNGRGTYTFASGAKYVGEYENGQSHGQGTYFFANGNMYVGEYKDGEQWNGVRYLASGKIWGTVSGGKPCEGCKPDSTQPAVAPDLSTLTVRSNPSHADTYIDNSYKGKTELEIELPPGYYSVRVEKSGYESFRQRIQLKQDMDLWASLTKDGAEPSLGSLELIGTGTGFVVNKDYVVTAEHVLEDCTAISIRHGHKEIDAKTVARDAANDLGLIRLSQPIRDTAKLRGGRPARKGERVSNYGYPLFGQLADSATITQGNINNLSGLGNDSRFIQFDAPSQPGNSGGPVLDSSGNVVGVASHILSKKYADRTGHIAQSVNFAVKSYLVEGFLSSNNVSFEKAESTEELKLPDIAEKAEKFTVLVECWGWNGERGERSTDTKDEYKNRPITVPTNATATVENKYGKYIHYYDPSKWTIAKNKSNDEAEFELSHRSGDGYAMFIFERIQVPLMNLTTIALENFQEFDSEAYIEEENRIIVNGEELVTTTMKGTYQGIDIVYYGYYLSGKWGALQAITFTGESLFDEYRDDFTEFLNGLVITD